MNCRNPHEFETITEKILRVILENIKGTQAYRDKEILKWIYFMKKK